MSAKKECVIVHSGRFSRLTDLKAYLTFNMLDLSTVRGCAGLTSVARRAEENCPEAITNKNSGPSIPIRLI
jgi:hypothetical protein